MTLHLEDTIQAPTPAALATTEGTPDMDPAVGMAQSMSPPGSAVDTAPQTKEEFAVLLITAI